MDDDLMTIDDLRTSMNNFMPTWVEIETDDDGEVIIRTRLKIREDGKLVDIED